MINNNHRTIKKMIRYKNLNLIKMMKINLIIKIKNQKVKKNLKNSNKNKLKNQELLKQFIFQRLIKVN